MNETLLFLIVGILLITIFLIFLRDKGRRSTEQLAAAAAEELQLESWPEELGERILGQPDWDYVYLNASPQVQRLFCAERKELALRWLYEVRRKSQAIMRAHRIRSIMSDSIRVPLELKLLLDYSVLRVTCEFAIFIVLFSNPTVLRRALRWAGGVKNRVRNLAELSVRLNALLKRENSA